MAIAVQQMTRHQITRAEYHRMIDSGVFGEDDRLELLEGDLITMMPIGPRHASAVNRLTRLLVQRIGERAVVAVQNPLRLDEHSEPQPDLALLHPRADDYSEALPSPRDVLLIIEVADSSASYDRDIKVHAYARAGIPEIWLVDLAEGRVEVYREPSATGYELVRRALPGKTISPSAFPDLTLAVSEVIP